MATVKTVLFDLDGTLVDSVELIVQSFERSLTEVLGSAPGRDEILPWLGRGLRDIMADIDSSRVDELVAAYREWNHAHHDELISPISGVLELVSQLTVAGYRVGVVTSKNNWLARRSLTVAGLSGVIDLTVGADDTSAHKPDPAPILMGLSRLETSPAAAVYVGDAVVDMVAARAANVRAVGVAWGAGGVDELLRAGADYVASSPVGLAKYLTEGC